MTQLPSSFPVTLGSLSCGCRCARPSDRRLDSIGVDQAWTTSYQLWMCSQPRATARCRVTGAPRRSQLGKWLLQFSGSTSHSRHSERAAPNHSARILYTPVFALFWPTTKLVAPRSRSKTHMRLCLLIGCTVRAANDQRLHKQSIRDDCGKKRALRGRTGRLHIFGTAKIENRSILYVGAWTTAPPTWRRLLPTRRAISSVLHV